MASASRSRVAGVNTPVTSTRQRPLPDPAVAREWLGAMLLVRRFDERAGELHGSGTVGGFLQLAMGEEGLIVGATRALEDRDWLLSTFRSHALALARGTEASAIMSELFGRVGGTNAGRGGAMHLTDPDRRFLGGFGLLGAHLPVAAGVALGASSEGRSEVAMAVLGEGAGSSGRLYEALELGSVWSLPLVLVVAQSGPPEDAATQQAIAALSRKAEGHGVKALTCDGMDVVDTQAVCAEAVRIARTERRPALVQATVMRAPTQSLSDPALTGDRAALAAWKGRDPVTRFGDRLVEVGLLETADRARMQMTVNSIVEQSVSAAGRSAHPDPGSLYDHSTADLYDGWAAVDTRGLSRPGERDPAPRAAP